MSLIEKILESSDEEIDSIISDLVHDCDQYAVQIGQLGFANSNNSSSVFKGFIPLKTRIKYSNFSVEDYGMETTTTDEEYFDMLKKNKIGDLKGKGAAECTERSALVQQILSIFGIESYYCMGCVDYNRQEPHCFNIVKRKKDYALLDYSLPVASYNDDGNIVAYYPFIASLTNEEFEDFIKNNTIKSSEDYHIKWSRSDKEGQI